MAAVCKVERENEETWDKVQARSAMTTKPVDGAAELGNQIARLMDALTRAGQGNSPGSTPNSPRHGGHGRGRTDRNTSSCSNLHNGWTGLGQATSACSISTGHRTGTTDQSQGNAQDPKMVRAVFQTKRTWVHSNVSDVKVRDTWLRSVPPQPCHLTRLGEPRESDPTPTSSS